MQLRAHLALFIFALEHCGEDRHRRRLLLHVGKEAALINPPVFSAQFLQREKLPALARPELNLKVCEPSRNRLHAVPVAQGFSSFASRPLTVLIGGGSATGFRLPLAAVMTSRFRWFSRSLHLEQRTQ
jgi:hypothetical protein